jgi:hypothetical protein
MPSPPPAPCPAITPLSAVSTTEPYELNVAVRLCSNEYASAAEQEHILTRNMSLCRPWLLQCPQHWQVDAWQKRLSAAAVRAEGHAWQVYIKPQLALDPATASRTVTRNTYAAIKNRLAKMLCGASCLTILGGSGSAEPGALPPFDSWNCLTSCSFMWDLVCSCRTSWRGAHCRQVTSLSYTSCNKPRRGQQTLTWHLCFVLRTHNVLAQPSTTVHEPC